MCNPCLESLFCFCWLTFSSMSALIMRTCETGQHLSALSSTPHPISLSLYFSLSLPPSLSLSFSYKYRNSSLIKLAGKCQLIRGPSVNMPNGLTIAMRTSLAPSLPLSPSLSLKHTHLVMHLYYLLLVMQCISEEGEN